MFCLSKTIFNFCKSKLLILLLLVFTNGSVFGQLVTTLISPTGDGGFENGTGFAANGWTGINSGLSWYVGTGNISNSTFSFTPTGSKCIYLSSSSSANTWAGGSGSTTISTAHFYRDVTFPSGNALNQLSFRWCAGGEISSGNYYDVLYVYLCPTTLTPVAGSPSGNSSIPTWSGTGTATLLGTYNLGALTGQTSTIYIPQSDIGNASAVSTMRLVFTWKNDAGNGTAPGLAIDDISLKSAIQCSLNGTYSVGPGGNYATLTDAINAIGLNGVSSDVTLELNASYTSAGETFPITLSNPANSGFNCMAEIYPVTIRPALGATGRSITSTNTTATIDINGGNYWIIDGRPGGVGSRDLAIGNTGAAPAVRFINDAVNNTIKYCTVTSTITPTTSGLILFSNTTGSTGNDNNTIDNCGLNGGSTASNLIYSSGSTGTSIQNNSNNTISNNLFFDFYNSTSTSNGGVGIQLSAGNTDWTITGNSFYQTATRSTYGNAATVNAILISNSGGNNFVITGNYIGGSAALCGSTPWTINSTNTVVFRAIQITAGSTSATSLQNNTIKNISVTTASTSTAHSAISLTTGSFNCGNVIGNIIGSQSSTGSISFVSTSATSATFSGIISGTGTPGNINISNNSIGGISVSNSSTGTVVFRGLNLQGNATSYTVSGNTIGSATTASSLSNATNNTVIGIYSSSTSASNTITGNTVANLSNTNTGGNAQVVGIYLPGSSGGAFTATGNTVRNLTNAGANIFGSTGTSVIGIILTAANTVGQNVSGNTIYDLSNTNSASVAIAVVGIYYSGPPAGANLVSRNLIYGITISTTKGNICGITAAGGATNYQNNMVSIGTGNGSGNNGISIIGMRDVAGGANLYHNTVYIGGTPTADANNTFAFFSQASVSSRFFQNNIFINARSNNGSTGKHYGIQVGGTVVNPTGLNSNYNIIQATGAGGVFGLFNSADQASLSAWQTATGQDLNSYDSDPKLKAPTATTPDLHIDATVTTDADAKGIDIPSITDDYDGETRSLLSPIDIGADAFSSVLPVRLINFSGYKEGAANRLRWSTILESNNLGFDIQRSNDGRQFNTIGRVMSLASNGYSNTLLNYQFKDLTAGVGAKYYRLNQISLDGRGELSKIILINDNNPNSTQIAIKGIYPNPASNQVSVWIASPEADKTQIIIADAAGKVVNAQSAAIELGTNVITLDIAAIPAGTYFVKVINSSGETHSTRFVKK